MLTRAVRMCAYIVPLAFCHPLHSTPITDDGALRIIIRNMNVNNMPLLRFFAHIIDFRSHVLNSQTILNPPHEQ